MSAQDHLNGIQFMGMADIKRLYSGVGEEGETVADTTPMSKAEGIVSGTHHALVESMRLNGQRTPIEVWDHSMLSDGHHRVAAAEDLGWSAMRVEHL